MLTYKFGKGFQNFSIYSGAVVFISLHVQQYLSIIIPQIWMVLGRSIPAGLE